MHIERLVLENVGGFETLDLPLHPKLNVLIGGNGAGKSTILRELRDSMITWLHPESTTAPEGAAKLVRAGQKRGRSRVHIRRDQAYRVEQAYGSDGRFSSSVEPTHAFEGLLTWHFLAANRLKPEGRVVDVELGDDYGASGVTSYTDFIEWFRDNENRENEVRLSHDGLASYRDPWLENVRRAYARLIGAVPGCDYERIRFTRVGPFVPASGLLVVDKAGTTLRVDQLSDGESTLLLMVGDIAHRLAEANPDLDDPLQGEGIVLIDAIELHLHPSWQRAILPALTQTFPDIQFIVTTHSPQVIGEVPRESVICLRDFQVVPTPPTYGRDSNSILEEVMGASSRDASVKAALSEIAALIDADAFDDARAKIEALSKTLGPDDPDLAGSRAAIDFLDGA